MATIAELCAQAGRLQGISDSARLDTELLLCHCLGKERSYLRAWPDVDISSVHEQQFQALFQRREQGEPIAYLIGSRGFWNLDLQVSPATLIPRPETELLVEQVLLISEQQSIKTVLDLGTGTGAIALALASEKPGWSVLGCDIQTAAVALAETNRQQCQIENAHFVQSSWFDNIAAQRFDIIVSNPPYIDPDDEHLNQGDVRFEPRSALVSANHGLADIEQIVKQCPAFLVDGGWLLLEHGYNQAKAVQQLLRQADFKRVATIQDLAGLDRVTLGVCRT